MVYAVMPGKNHRSVLAALVADDRLSHLFVRDESDVFKQVTALAFKIVKDHLSLSWCALHLLGHLLRL